MLPSLRSETDRAGHYAAVKAAVLLAGNFVAGGRVENPNLPDERVGSKVRRDLEAIVARFSGSAGLDMHQKIVARCTYEQFAVIITKARRCELGDTGQGRTGRCHYLNVVELW